MASDYHTNEKVKWRWGKGFGEGYIRDKYTDSVTLTLQGEDVTRDASPNNPAYLIEQQDGAEVLKLASEISKAS
ncbi:DUF2945 domain-containing protein [Aestuariibacter sp. AA17]|uniref:DUF2945 domain-containing protein n=1 Tax=Fluctibacter corallii TaxID=2984329 RepID=A0ABT3A434_9ALTE|nr:DUF2945 domain-containing protein [Aestuariibacter sp. AA17]MCV2883452.1 DUF2945 domain-containing protein [Aestuariibacter sp. AA17]